MRFVDLPCPTSIWQAVKTLPRQVLSYWRAIGPARIVHAGFGGWPIIQAWLAVPLAKLRGKFVLANVESSPWRASVPGLPWYVRLGGYLGERMTRYCLRLSDIRLFTSKSYLQELLPPQSPRAYVTPATWLNNDWLLDDGEAEAVLGGQRGPCPAALRGRLMPEKGLAMAPVRDQGRRPRPERDVRSSSGLVTIEECIAFAENRTHRQEVREDPQARPIR